VVANGTEVVAGAAERRAAPHSVADDRAWPAFRAEHIGSFLRPAALMQARRELLGADRRELPVGAHHDARLRRIEDESISAVVAMQERLGFGMVTDGEFRRFNWWLDLVLGWEGFAIKPGGTLEFAWRNKSGDQPFTRLMVTGPIRWRPGNLVRSFEFVRDRTRRVAKVTLPTPIITHLHCGGDPGLSAGYYKDPDRFWGDFLDAYRQELRALVAAGVRYIQFDDTTFAFLCDERNRAAVAAWGIHPDKLLAFYADRMNDLIADLPPEVRVALHQCRGNRQGYSGAEGGYDQVAELMFNGIHAHRYQLEFASARAGSFAPLRHLPKGKRVVLGLLSSKHLPVEPADELRRRIEEAARYVPVEQLAISPQCGFSSNVMSQSLTQADQEAKLARIIEVAQTVWGEN
jgi:5-methyltetrahydropteroyltriglutamate--homocysteine methyltransferase